MKRYKIETKFDPKKFYNVTFTMVEDPHGNIIFYEDIINLIESEIVEYKNMAKYAAWADAPFEVMALAKLLKKIEGNNNSLKK